MEIKKNLSDAISSLEKYISEEKFRGYDPYDGLMSPLFKLPILNSNKTIRLYWQQAFRRLPCNARTLFGIKKGYNPVTLGLCIQAYTYLLKSGFSDERITAEYIEKTISHLINELKLLSSKGFSGYCWGYDFDWEAKYASNPAYTPTIVATGIITNGLFEYYRYSQRSDVFEIIKSSSEFVLRDLQKSTDEKEFCYSYSPFDKQKVYNASMKAVRLLSQVYSITGEPALAEEAGKAAAYVIKNQNDNGSWCYSNGDGRIWVDNFHTGYVLDCLDEYINCTGRTDFTEKLKKGYSYYRNNFFTEVDGYTAPKYYDNRLYPVDSTALAQSVLTLCRFGDEDTGKRIFDFALSKMSGEGKYFYYRMNKLTEDRTSYMRWSNAWMFCAMSYLYWRITETNA